MGGDSDGWHGVRLQLEEATRGEFEVVKELGRGGMAAVYLARDLALGRDVAIKVMAPGLLMGPGMVERFRQEAVTIAKLHHPNIVTIHTVGQAGHLHFFVMQFVEGASLETILERFESVPIHLTQVILYQLGVGLSYAHRRGVVHRDIKPGNALLDREGNAILTDFGIAKVTTASNLTQTGSTIGTPAYMSPEQCRAGELSGASDQYSLGVVAYEMLTGAPPFSGSPFDIMQAHTAAAPPRIRDRRPDCPPELEAAVYRMMAKDPADRFGDVAEAIEAIGGFLPGPHDPVREEMACLVDPGRGPAPAARGAFAPTPGRAVTPTPSAGAATPQPAPRGKARVPLWAVGVAALALVGASVGAYLWLSPEGPPPAPVTTPSGVSRITFPSPTEEVLVGTSLRISANLLDEEGRALSGQPVEWASDDPSIASVEGATEEALVTGMGPGTVMVRARTGGLEGGVEVVVSAPGAGEFRVSAPGRELVIGSELTLTAVLTDQTGQRVTDPEVSWTSGNPSILEVGRSTGVVRGVSLGRAQVRATAGEESRSVELTVIGRVESIAVVPPSDLLRAGGNSVLRASVTSLPAGFLGPEGLAWSSSNPAVASVALAGADSVVLALLTPGEAILTARTGAVQSAVTLRVLAPPVAVTLALSSGLVPFQAVEGGAAPADQTVTVSVTGEATPTLGAVQYASGASGWLSPMLGTTAGAQTALVLRADPRGLGEGEYSARVPVRAGGESREVEVRLRVAPDPGAGRVEPSDAAAQELTGLLQRYAAAIGEKNVNRIREIFPSISQAAIDDLRRLRDTDTYYLQLSGSLRPGDREGTLEGDVMSGVLGPDGRGQLVRMIYTFGRGQGGWYIVSLRPGG